MKIRSTQPSNFAALKFIAGKTEDIPTLSNLPDIKYVPTILHSFNRAIILGGAPVGAMWTIHGPTTGGKTALSVALINSFIQQGHFAAYIDAECAASKKWFMELGADPKMILFEQPDTFEDAIDLVDLWIENFKKGKATNQIPSNKYFIIVVDTIHKLVPMRELEALRKSSRTKKDRKKKMIKGWGRLRANMIQVWLDKLTPIVGKNEIAFVAIAQERDKEPEHWGDDDYIVKGGQGLLYDASVRIRVNEAEKLVEPVAGTNKNKIVGKQHTYTVIKNKVGYPNERGIFYTSNGRGKVPIGFDLYREAFQEALRRNIILQSGPWYTLPCQTKLQGESECLTYLRENQESNQILQNQLFENLKS